MPCIYFHYSSLYSIRYISKNENFQKNTTSGTAGRFVELPTVLDNFEEILAGKCDDIPEGAFYMCGDLAEVKEKAAKLIAQATR